MNRAKFTSTFAKLVLTAMTTSGMFAMGTQKIEAQAIVATTPFDFSAGSQLYRAGTYEFTLLSEWTLSIRNVNGGNEQFFTTHPEDESQPGAKGRLIFDNSNGHRSLLAICMPGAGITAALVQQGGKAGGEKTDRLLASLHASSDTVKAAKHNVSGR